MESDDGVTPEETHTNIPMPWLITSNDDLQQLKSKHTDGEILDSGESNSCQTTESAAEKATEHYDTIAYKED